MLRNRQTLLTLAGSLLAHLLLEQTAKDLGTLMSNGDWMMAIKESFVCVVAHRWMTEARRSCQRNSFATESARMIWADAKNSTGFERISTAPVNWCFFRIGPVAALRGSDCFSSSPTSTKPTPSHSCQVDVFLMCVSAQTVNGQLT